MERKLVRLGTSTLVISLPSKWVKQHGLTDADRLTVRILPSQEILISKGKPRPLPSGTAITVKPDMTPYTLRRKVEAAYIQGFREVRVEGMLSEDQEEALHRELQSLMGMELVDQRRASLLLRDVGADEGVSFHHKSLTEH